MEKVEKLYKYQMKDTQDYRPNFINHKIKLIKSDNNIDLAFILLNEEDIKDEDMIECTEDEINFIYNINNQLNM